MTGEKSRLAFFGTPEFAVPTLTALYSADLAPVVVVTQPARAAGRGRSRREPPVARFAMSRGLEVRQPRSIRKTDFLQGFEACEPELAIVVAYGKIFPPSLLRIPRLGCVNLHASLLPKYRGAAPIQAAIAEGETETGVTTMLMEEGLDTGPILLQAKIAIGEDETADRLSRRLADLGADLVLETVAGLRSGALVPQAQDDAAASYAPLLHKEDSAVDWRLSARRLSDRLRAFTPWPGLTATLGEAAVRLVRARPLAVAGDPSEPGTVLGLRDGRLAVECGGGSVLGIELLQRPGRRALAARDFVNGERLRPGDRFG